MSPAFILSAAMAAATVLVIPADAQAQQSDRCAATTVSVQPGSVVVEYDPFEAAPTYGDFALRVETSDCPPNRTLFAEFDPVDGAQSVGRELRLTGADGSTVRAFVVDERGADARGAAQFFKVERGIEPFALAIAPGQVVVPGDYRIAMSANVSANNGLNTPSTAGLFDLVVRVRAAIGLAPAGGFALDLGELAAGGSAASPATFDAYANVPYRLEVTSDAGFVLKSGPGTAAAGPAYRAVLDASALDAGLSQRDFDRPAVNSYRRRHALDVQVGAVSGFPAGRYSDYLTVQISALLGS